MKSDRPRRTRAGKLAVHRNFGSPGVGKGRLRSTKRERKLSAQAHQTSETADRDAEVAPVDVAEGTLPKKAEAPTGHGAVERHRTTAAEVAKSRRRPFRQQSFGLWAEGRDGEGFQSPGPFEEGERRCRGTGRLSPAGDRDESRSRACRSAGCAEQPADGRE